MIDLNTIDLKGLPNVDDRLIPHIKKYFNRIMELQGNPLDYRIETMFNDIKSGELKILVGSNDRNSADYSDDLGKYNAGAYYNKGTLKSGDGKSTIIVDYKKFSDEMFHIISHEMEHYISCRFKGKEGNTLTSYSIIGEPATEIGYLYNLFKGNEKEVIENIFKEDREHNVAYKTAVKLLVICNQASGHRITEIIQANRDNDFDYFSSIIPKKYIEKISLLYDDFFEGKCINEIGNQPAMMLYDAIKQLENYMWDNYEEYPNMSDELVKQISSILEGYETIIDEKDEINLKLGNNAIFDINYLDEDILGNIENEILSIVVKKWV